MDVGSGSGYPSSALSNFAPHPFEIDGVKCNSMEGFLQSLKFKNEDMQKHVCTLVGKKAKFKGKKKKWWNTGLLYWKGKEIDRFGDEYQVLLDHSFVCLSKNTKFSKALVFTNNSTLTHSIGKNDKKRTILTTQEFCKRLYEIRGVLQKYISDKE